MYHRHYQLAVHEVHAHSSLRRPICSFLTTDPLRAESERGSTAILSKHDVLFHGASARLGATSNLPDSLVLLIRLCDTLKDLQRENIL
ncbi:hypothetical protein NDU88_004053 [Pleurodeles waltl]|uniref:Uncharacterized protein n=1 Tax=Pleurodeles waltl TaxID=8319 RepID=A0AAV7LK90_PLEWA|nr:hypothetical protein NDU88_004053 [Pleurodeles waltl]